MLISLSLAKQRVCELACKACGIRPGLPFVPLANFFWGNTKARPQTKACMPLFALRLEL